MMVVYELHAYSNSAWKLDSVFDDRDLAVIEARQVELGKHYAGVRVLEETLDDASNRTISRTIYRSTKSEPPHAIAVQRQGQRAQLGGLAQLRVAGADPAKQAGGSRNLLWVGTLTIGALLICALGALLTLTDLIR